MAVKHTFKSVKGELITKNLTPSKAIRWACIHCMQSLLEPKNCTSKDCALWPFRLGHGAQDVETGEVLKKRKKNEQEC